MRSLLVATAVPLVIALSASWTARIVRRHDVPDARYLEAASRVRGLVHMNLSKRPEVGDGEGTLIARDWVLTAAHVAHELRLGHVVSSGSQRMAIDRICIHPKAAADPPHDLALVHLAAPVTAISAVPLYRKEDEVGREVLIAGYGDNGDGRSGSVVADARVRAATNRVDEVDAQWIIFAFDPPGSPRTTALEGVSGPGDSGGPAFITVGGRLYLAGVSSRQDIGPTGGQQMRYGVREMYARVSTHANWIDSTMLRSACGGPR